MAKLPIVTPTRKFDVQFINGQSIFDLREQLLNILSQDAKSDLFREFFAEPIVNHAKGEISWYSQSAGEVRHFADLNPDERQLISDTIRNIDDSLRSTAAKLSSSNPQSAWLGTALRAMLLVPNVDQSVFLVGGRAVLSQWGCIPLGSDPSKFSISVQDASTALHAVATGSVPAADGRFVGAANAELPAHSAKAPLVEPLPSDAAPPPPAAHSVVAQPFEWRQLLPWLLALLLLLLLLLSFYLIHYYRQHAAVPTYSAEIAQERAEIDRLWGAIDLKARQCFPPAASAPTPDITPPPANQAAPTDQSAPPIEDKVIEQTLEENGIVAGEEVNISLAWRSRDDLDLAVKDPRGEVIFYKKRRSSTGGTLDIDAHASCAASTNGLPVENISWNSLPLPGVYTIEVSLFDKCGTPDLPVPFTIVISGRNASESRIDGVISLAERMLTYPFEVQGR